MVELKYIHEYYELNQEDSARVFGGTQSSNSEKLEFATLYPSIDGSPPRQFPVQATGCF